MNEAILYRLSSSSKDCTKKKVMNIFDLEILEVLPQANQVQITGSFAWARARAYATGRFTRMHTFRYTHSDANGSVSLSGSSSSASS